MLDTLKQTDANSQFRTRNMAFFALTEVAVLTVLLLIAVTWSRPDADKQTVVVSPSASPIELQEPSATTYIDDDRTTPTAKEALLENIIEDPEAYTGQQVTVTGVVNVVYTDRAFLLDGPGLINDTILVISKTAYNVESFESVADTTKTSITISGTVGVFDLATVESMLNSTLSSAQLDTFARKLLSLLIL